MYIYFLFITKKDEEMAVVTFKLLEIDSIIKGWR